MHKLSMVALCALSCTTAIQAAGQEWFPAAATYHVESGDVVLVEFTGLLEALQVSGPGVKAFNLPDNLGTTFVEVKENEITWQFLQRPWVESLVLQGALPTGLSEDELKTDYRAKVVIFDDPTLRAAKWEYIAVPEASSIAITCMGAVAIFFRRQRRH